MLLDRGALYRGLFLKAIARLVARVVGTVFMAAAVLQWLTFNYPDINPFWPGAVFASGLLSQVLNWLLVCVLATIGWGFFTYGKFKLK